MDIEGLYDINYRSVNGKPIVYLFIRNKDRTKTVKEISGFRPYIYIDKETFDKQPKPNEVIEVTDDCPKTIFNKRVMKCYLKRPSDMYYVRELYSPMKYDYSKIYEADILFSLRYAIDKIGKVTPTEYKVLTWDIETDCHEGFPRKDNPIEPIICISAHDNYSDKIITFVFLHTEEQRQEVESLNNEDIKVFSKEEDMLTAFLEYWQQQDADIATGWNTTTFDTDYLYARLQHLKIPMDKLSAVDGRKFDRIRLANNGYRDSNATVKKRTKGELEILGLVLFDCLRAYRQLHFGELTSYSLNSIAEQELGEEKEPVYNTGKVWRKDINKLISYNRKDVELVVKIEKKCKLISLFDSVKRFAGVRNLSDCFYMSRVHDTKILRKYRGKYVFPTKPIYVERGERQSLQGAYVFSKPGLYNKVATLDFSGLYPNIIKTFNLSPEMISNKGIEVNGVTLSHDRVGIMPSVIDDLLELKAQLKKEIQGAGSQDARDQMFAVKIVINSIWGIFALSNFRLYNNDLANCVTYVGRYLIQKASKIIEEQYGYEIVMNDTDSVGIVIPEGIDAVQVGQEMQIKVNDEIDKILREEFKLDKHSINIELEKVAKTALFQTKKRYAMHIVWEDGKVCDKIKAVGFDVRRSDTSQIGKDVQRTVLTSILKGHGKEEVVKYIDGIIKDMKSGKISIEDIAFPVKLNKHPEEYVRTDKLTGKKIQSNLPKLRGVKWSNKNIGTMYHSGDKFKMIYVHHPETDTICFEDEHQLKQIENLCIDWSAMIDKNIHRKIEGIFATIGWDSDDTSTQTTLSDYN